MKAIALLLVSLAALVTGCTSPLPQPGGSTTAPQGTPTSGQAAQTAGDDPFDGTWTKHLTEADVAARGIERSLDDLDFAPDGTLDVTLKFTAGNWTQFANYDGDAAQPGDVGTYRLDDNGDLELYSSSEGGSISFSWDLQGDDLTLRFANPSEVNPDEAAIVSLLTEGTFTRIMP